MSNKPCRITFLAFMFGDIPKGKANGYEDHDLENSIQYCSELLEEGFAKEPHDGFNLKKFIKWAKKMMN